MRFPLAAIGFLVTSFIFFVLWAFVSLYITTVVDALTPLAADLSDSTVTGYLTLLPTALGVFCAIFFFVGIILIFVLDSLSDEPEYYPRERY